MQRDSYEWFLDEGLREVFEDISPIRDYAGNLILEFIDYSIDESPKYDVEECKDRDVTYAAPLKVKVRLINKETGEVKEQEVFMGDFPLMTDKGTFIYNGAERVIVTQLVRSPGPYYDMEIDKTGRKLFSTTIIPNRGAWLEYETDSNEIVSVRVDRTRKQPATALLRALGFGSDMEILQLLGEDERLLRTLEKDHTNNIDEGLLEIYKKLRPGEPPTVESAKSLIDSLFFDPKRYDLAKVGRYKYNKKLGLAKRLTGCKLAEDVIDPNTGEILGQKDEKVSREKAIEIENAGIKAVDVLDEEDKLVKIVGNNFVDIDHYVDINIDHLQLPSRVYYPVLKEIVDNCKTDKELLESLASNKNRLSPKHIIVDDIIASVSYILNLSH
ncbi:MAG: hypothetical protein MI799_18085, partial [Desulfobacterales bacterium]|nr:hypothetical protein [Desulfobacterales bacterium]